MTDYSWIAPTIAALVAAYLSVRAANEAREGRKAIGTQIAAVDVKVEAVKKATDGMTSALVNNASEKGRAEGAAIATAGAAAAAPLK